MGGAMVMVDGSNGVCVCPFHGAQAGAEYAAGLAPCGCRWDFDRRGVLRAQPPDVKTYEHATLLRLEHNTACDETG